LGLLLIIIPVNTITTLQSDNLITWFSMAKCDHVMSEETILNSGDNKKMLEDKLDEIRNCLSENNIQADIFQEALFKMKISHGDKKTTSLAFQGIGDITVDEYMYESGSAPQNGNEVAITSIIADRIGVQIGDDVQIQDGDITKTYTVCGLFQSMNNLGEGIRFHQDAEIDYSYSSGAFGIQIRYKDNPDSKTLFERKNLLKENFPDGKIFTASEYISSMIGNITGQLDSVKQLILAVVLCINVLVTVLMVKSFLTKEKGEIAMLKAIGFSNGSLVEWQTLRIGIVMLISVILAVLLSTPLSHVTIEPIFRMMGAQSIEFFINPLEVYVVYPLTVLGITTLAGFLTSLQIKKINPSETANIE
jgi:putative ABC transport system permease protein